MPLVALEGLDGAGKSTQIQLLAERLRCTLPPEKQEVHIIHFPRLDEAHVGPLLCDYLEGRLKLPEGMAGLKLLATLFAADRAECREQILQWMAKDEWVLVDRYYFSNIAYQSAKVAEGQRKELADWIRKLERGVMGMPLPDSTLYLKMPLEICEQQLTKRRAAQGGAADIHEADKRLLLNVQRCYEAMAVTLELGTIDCARPIERRPYAPLVRYTPEEVAAQVWDAVGVFLTQKIRH